jgi:hypothetical protein
MVLSNQVIDYLKTARDERLAGLDERDSVPVSRRRRLIGVPIG